MLLTANDALSGQTSLASVRPSWRLQTASSGTTSASQTRTAAEAKSAATHPAAESAPSQVSPTTPKDGDMFSNALSVTMD